MQRLREFYFSLYFFWFRFDLYTKSREIKELKALIAITVVQVWAFFGCSIWVEIWLGRHVLERGAFVLVVTALCVANYGILQGRGWETYEREFQRHTVKEKRVRMVVAGAASLVAFILTLSALIVKQSVD